MNGSHDSLIGPKTNNNGAEVGCLKLMRSVRESHVSVSERV